MSAPVYLSALGLVNALGDNPASVLANLLEGRAPGMRLREGWIVGRSVYVGEVVGELPVWPQALAHYASRNNQLLLAAAQQIAEPLQAAILRYGRERIGVVIGSSTSGIREGELAVAAALTHGSPPADYDYRQQEIGTPALALAAALDLQGIAYTVSTACSSSAKSFASARNLLAQDWCDAVVVGGADSLCGLTLNGFMALDALAQGLCNPFSANRDGIVIGEAAALFLMTREAGPVALLGVGESADAHHVSAPHPQGEGAIAAMQAALLDAGLTADAIDYINLHGTGTALNDAMESRAVAQVFGASVACSSTKALTGHTLGAAGATELALCWLMLCQPGGVRLPAQRWDGVRDGTLVPIGLLNAERTLPGPAPKRFLSNSFAFGGSNCALIVESCAQ